MFRALRPPFSKSIRKSRPSLVMSSQFSTASSHTLSSSAPPREAEAYIDFLNEAAPSPFHAVHSAVARLEQAGFRRLSERDDWDLERKGKYYFTRNGSTVLAFTIGGKYKHGNGGFSIVGAHTDSPQLKVKPVSKREKAGYLEVGVQLYGGGLWHTWFDRSLGVAGRVMVRLDDGSYRQRLVRISKPILTIPTLAVHFDGAQATRFNFNEETQLLPILATKAKDALNARKTGSEQERHHSALMEALAKELDVHPDQINDFDLSLYDTQPACIGGVHDEFVFSQRQDNLGMSYCSLMGMINTCNRVDEDPNIRVLALFDNEEVGSTSAQGANSSLLPATLERLICTNIQDDDVSLSCLPGLSRANGKNAHPKVLYERAIHKSLLLSADMAHAVHPNFLDQYEDNHRPQMHHGTVIKINANQRYATTAPTSLIIREIAGRRDIPVQEFVVRNDGRCGSTIGAMLSAKMSLRTVDVGNPQLSMHSLRETTGVDDVKHGIDLFEAFYELFPAVESQVFIDNE